MSGRGPFRRVVCTFGHTESCSAYGLRAVEEVAGSLPQAIGLIRARLRRCGSAALYRLPADCGARPALLWGEALDREPADLDAELCQAGEREHTRALVLRARAAVARDSGDARVLRQCVTRARALTPERSRLVVRRGAGVVRALRRRLVQRLVVLALMLVSVMLVAPPWLALVCAALGGDIGWRWVHRHGARVRRMDRQLAASRFGRPVFYRAPSSA